MGRPFVYGLCVGGQDGVEAVIKNILADLELSLGLAGFKNLDEIRGKSEEILVRIDHSKL